MKKHFNDPTNKGSANSEQKEYGRPIITSQASNTRTLEKQDLQKNLRTKFRSWAKDPNGGNLLTTTTVTTGLVKTGTGSIRRSHSIISVST